MYTGAGMQPPGTAGKGRASRVSFGATPYQESKVLAEAEVSPEIRLVVLLHLTFFTISFLLSFSIDLQLIFFSFVL